MPQGAERISLDPRPTRELERLSRRLTQDRRSLTRKDGEYCQLYQKATRIISSHPEAVKDGGTTYLQRCFAVSPPREISVLFALVSPTPESAYKKPIILVSLRPPGEDRDLSAFTILPPTKWGEREAWKVTDHYDQLASPNQIKLLNDLLDALAPQPSPPSAD